MIAFYARHYLAIPVAVFALSLIWLATDPDTLHLILVVCVAVWLVGAIGVWFRG